MTELILLAFTAILCGIFGVLGALAELMEHLADHD